MEKIKSDLSIVCVKELNKTGCYTSPLIQETRGTDWRYCKVVVTPRKEPGSDIGMIYYLRHKNSIDVAGKGQKIYGETPEETEMNVEDYLSTIRAICSIVEHREVSRNEFRVLTGMVI